VQCLEWITVSIEKNEIIFFQKKNHQKANVRFRHSPDNEPADISAVDQSPKGITPQVSKPSRKGNAGAKGERNVVLVLEAKDYDSKKKKEKKIEREECNPGKKTNAARTIKIEINPQQINKKTGIKRGFSG
jgi:hydroxymethylpyrimidine pyrophosphatase-like HAD family hydrolase